MKNGPVFYLGLFSAMALSWGGIMLANKQLGTLAPHFDENEAKAFPEHVSGIAARGQLVYADLGCAACHTQQVRRPGFGTDQARGWGERQSFARDYIHQTTVQLGESRMGPDLANLASRKPPPDVEDLTNLLYHGRPLDPLIKNQHPTYKFLFETREIVGQRAANALKVPNLAPNLQVVPTERAQTLVAYLLSLNNSYDYPAETAFNTVKAAAKEAGHGAPGAEKNTTPAKEAGHK
jgi:cytochrome c oxidase cbb3-type subunit II